MKKVLFAIITLLTAICGSAANPSGTLPIMHIETSNRQAINSKENYVDATYWLDPSGDTEIEAVGSESAPLPLQIRGRGNYTWTGFDKKPYRLKLGSKASLCGMPKSKHWVLLAHADDDRGFLREPLGFYLSQKMGLSWTPGQYPVEVVLNGEYIGLYFLVENIRVAKDRVNILDQDENPSDDVTGGWLVEIDNYEDEDQVSLWEGNGYPLRVTYHSPEDVITPAHLDFLRDQFQSIDNAIYQHNDMNALEALVDIESLVAFTAVQEIMDGQESFHGSCYLHRDQGQDKKWVWGPVWDFGNTMHDNRMNKHCWEDPDWGQTWIPELVKFGEFRSAVEAKIRNFFENDYESTIAYLTSFAQKIEAGARADAARWPQYGNSDEMGRLDGVRSYLKSRLKFLLGDNIFPEGSGLYLRGDMTGWAIDSEYEFTLCEDGVYRLNNVYLRNKRVKIADKDWTTHDWGLPTENTYIVEGEETALTFKGKDIFFEEGFFERIEFRVIEPQNSATVRFYRTVPQEEEEGGDEGALRVVEPTMTRVVVAGQTVSMSDGSAAQVYGLSGQLMGTTPTRLLPGVYIVKGKDGKAVKIVL